MLCFLTLIVPRRCLSFRFDVLCGRLPFPGFVVGGSRSFVRFAGVAALGWLMLCEVSVGVRHFGGCFTVVLVCRLFGWLVGVGVLVAAALLV